MHRFSYQRINKIVVSIVRILLLILLIIFLSSKIQIQFSEFSKWFFAYYGHNSEAPIWDFFKKKGMLLIFETTMLVLFLYMLIDHLQFFIKNFESLDRSKHLPSKVETFLFSIVRPLLRKGIFPKNYLSWFVLFIITDGLRPKTFQETDSDFNSRNLLVFVLTVFPPILLALDVSIVASKFKGVIYLLSSVIFSGMCYLFIVNNATQVGGEWTLSYIISYALLIMSIPLSILYGLFLQKIK